MKHTFHEPFFVMLVLLLAALACSQPTVGTPALPGTAVPVETQPAPTLAPAEIPTQMPTPVPTAIPTIDGRLVTFENFSFVVPNGLSQSEMAMKVSPVTGGAPWDVTVEHTQFTFSGYPLSGTARQPEVFVFPSAGFDMAAETIASLQNLLALRPTGANPMPFLPPSNTVQMFQAQVKYLDFGGGGGVRYLTQDGQGIAPVNNQSLFYTYQGLTSDGRYYVSVIMPVSHNQLPASSDGANLEELANDYAGYISVVPALLDGQPEAGFTPNLAALDALVQSITVK